MKWKKPFMSIATVKNYEAGIFGNEPCTTIEHFTGDAFYWTGPFKIIDWDKIREG